MEIYWTTCGVAVGIRVGGGRVKTRNYHHEYYYYYYEYYGQNILGASYLNELEQ